MVHSLPSARQWPVWGLTEKHACTISFDDTSIILGRTACMPRRSLRQLPGSRTDRLLVDVSYSLSKPALKRAITCSDHLLVEHITSNNWTTLLSVRNKYILDPTNSMDLLYIHHSTNCFAKSVDFLISGSCSRICVPSPPPSLVAIDTNGEPECSAHKRSHHNRARAWALLLAKLTYRHCRRTCARPHAPFFVLFCFFCFKETRRMQRPWCRGGLRRQPWREGGC